MSITVTSPTAAQLDVLNYCKCPTTDAIDQMVEKHMRDVVEQHELVRLVADPKTSPELTAAVVRHTMLESFSFTPILCELTLKAIGRMPHDRPDDIKSAFLHIHEELDHGEMGMRTFVKLGGNEAWGRQRRMTPGSMAMCGAFQRVIEQVSGVAYIGFWYPLECMTAILTERAMGWMGSKGFGADQREFIDVHAEDDIAHQRSMRRLIKLQVEHRQDAHEEIVYATEVLLSVYPTPIWDHVVARAKADIQAEAGQV